jgi:prephenate dehydrogenase
LIGASIGLRARGGGARTIGYDERPEHAERARDRGALDRVASTAGECFEADVLVLATPLEGTLALLAELAAHPPHATLVLDVCSVKADVARAGSGLESFVPSHPMAGSEQSGPQAARTDLFEGCVWMYAPAARSAQEEARAFILSMGARPLALDPAEHDRIVALTSALPQLVSVALGAQLEERLGQTGVAELCGPGMRSMLRLGSSSWPVWRGVLAANAGAVSQEVRGLVTILSEFARALEAGEVPTLAPAFAEAARAVQRLNE